MAYETKRVEEWREVPAYEGLFEVSNLGQVRAFEGDPVRQTTGSGGYRLVRLRRDGKVHLHRVHSLVALAFLGPRPLRHCVRHLDGNPQRNELENLAYGTWADNARDAIRHGRNPRASKTHCIWGHVLSGANVRPYTKQRPQQRMCVSCNLATSLLRRRGFTRKSPEFGLLADQIYADRMKSVAA